MNIDNSNNKINNNTSVLDNEYTEFNSREYNPFIEENYYQPFNNNNQSNYINRPPSTNNNTYRFKLNDKDRKNYKSIYKCGIWATILWFTSFGLIAADVVFTMSDSISAMGIGFIVFTVLFFVTTLVLSTTASTIAIKKKYEYRAKFFKASLVLGILLLGGISGILIIQATRNIALNMLI